MTGAVLDRPTLSTERAEMCKGITLEELLDSTLDAARTNGSAECPVCQARMGPARMTSARADARVGAECGGCGSRLS